MKAIFSALFAFLFTTNVLFAQVSLNLGHDYGNDIISAAKANFQNRVYDPLAESKNLVKTAVISLWNTQGTNWQAFANVSVRQDNTCSQVQSISVLSPLAPPSKDTFIYVNSRLVQRSGPESVILYGYVGTRVVPDTVRETDVASGDNTLSLYTYDANNLPASVLVKRKNGVNFIDTARATYKHNAAGQLIYFKEDRWVSTGQRWANDETDSIFYNTEGKFSRMVFMSGGTFPSTLEIVYTYDANKRVTQILTNQLLGTQYTPIGKRVVPANRYHFNGLPLELINMNINGTTVDSIEKDIFTYNGAFSVISNVNQEYTNARWVNSSKIDYTYCGQRVGTLEKQLLEAQLSVSPNPVTEQLSLRLEAENPSMDVQIFDATGKLVWRKQHNAMQLDVSVADFSKGMYIVKVRSGAYFGIQKFVKI